MSHALDDAAAAALAFIDLNKPRSFEHLGLLYEQGEAIRRTDTRSSNDRESARGRFAVPSGSLRGLFHNHPLGPYENSRRTPRAQFSPDDVEQARALGVPSYISAGDRVMRYDPDTGASEEVLAQFPMDEFRAYLMRTLLDRSADDPRGLTR